jgi:putative ABC transport system ATP-binding protein
MRPMRGSATYGDRPMWQGDGDPRPEVAFVLQVYGLVPILSARENIAVALRARGCSPREADERADHELRRFHIGDLGDRQVEELSGGQMQRVACARGFAVGADILLADEPTSELDEGNREHVMEQLQIEARRGAIVAVATHDPAVVAIADRRYVLDDGVLTDHVAPVTDLHVGFGG